MLNKVKEKISEEVSSATDKLQSMQLASMTQHIDGRGSAARNAAPFQPLPEIQDLIGISTSTDAIQASSSGQFTDILGGLRPSSAGLREVEELDAQLSPQEQLFNESIIPRLNLLPPALDSNSHNSPSINLVDGPLVSRPHSDASGDWRQSGNSSPQSNQNVICINELSSDIECEDTINPDDEVDLLSTLTDNHKPSEPSQVAPQHKAKYRQVVQLIRKLDRELRSTRDTCTTERAQFTDEIRRLKDDLQTFQNKLLQASSSGSPSNSSNTAGAASTSQKSNKLRDLERIIAKCKESLKLKNTQIQKLKETVANHEEFKQEIDRFKRELDSLKLSHESQIISIAENKRLMHEEIESKHNEMSRLRKEAEEQKALVTARELENKQLRKSIQDLESRLVSTSAAHQKERESLSKELTIAKNQALRQLQKEHETNLERVKLDLEKSIETLKAEILTKDELIIRSADQTQRAQKDNQVLSAKVADQVSKLALMNEVLEETKKDLDQIQKSCSELQEEVDVLKKFRDETLADSPVRNPSGDTGKCSENLPARESAQQEDSVEHRQASDALLEPSEVVPSPKSVNEAPPAGQQQNEQDPKQSSESEPPVLAEANQPEEEWVPSATEFEYLKNIVYQFMLGREPLTLARVIAAVFKFDKTQIEQICKTQEVLQAVIRQSG